MRLLRVVSLLALLAGMASPSPSRAAWPSDPSVNVRVTGAKGHQQTPQAVSDGAGGVLIVWSDGRDTTNIDIYAHHILASGDLDPAWPVDGLPLCNAAGSQTAPVLISNGAGGGIAVWSDNRAVVDLYAQHVLVGGAVDPTWPVDGVAVTTATGSQWAPSLASDGAGGVLVAFVDNGGGGSCDIRTQHILPSGVTDPAWPLDGRYLCQAPDCQDAPSIVTDGSGGALVVWEDARDGLQFDIYAMHVLANSSLAQDWPADGAVVCSAADNQYLPSAVSDGMGGAIVAWEDWRSPFTGSDIFATRLLPNGTSAPGWPVNGRSLCAASYPQEAPRALMDGSGGAVAVWIDSRDLTHKPYAHRVTSNGALATGWPLNGRQLSVQAGDAQFAKDLPVLVSDGAGGAIVAWQDDHGSPIASDIEAQHLLSTGALDGYWAASGVVVSSATGKQIDATIVSDGDGGAIVAWCDERNRSTPGQGRDIYAQRVDRHGVLGTPVTGVDGGGPSRGLELAANPNPTMAAATIRFALPEATSVRLVVYDLGGRQLRTLSEASRGPGWQTVEWDLRDDHGRRVSAGLYFVRLEAGGERRICRLAVGR